MTIRLKNAQKLPSPGLSLATVAVVGPPPSRLQVAAIGELWVEYRLSCAKVSEIKLGVAIYNP
jgi:hypothetical protein